MTKSKVGIIVGRMQPYHAGHHSVVLRALHEFDLVIIMLGTRNSPRSLDDPLTVAERVQIIRSALSDDDLDRVVFVQLNDQGDDGIWRTTVTSIIDRVLSDLYGPRFRDVTDVSIVGHRKDGSSYYLDLFEGRYRLVEMDMEVRVSATDLRERIYSWLHESDEPFDWRRYPEFFVDEAHAAKVVETFGSDELQPVLRMFSQRREYQERWGMGPFVTASSLVLFGDSILCVRRGRPPFEGMLALPGGFIEPGETSLNAALRELREETSIDDPLLRTFLSDVVVADRVGRDPRASVIDLIHVFAVNPYYLNLEPRAGDDAASVEWVKTSNLMDLRYSMAFDHWDIIQKAARAAGKVLS